MTSRVLPKAEWDRLDAMPELLIDGLRQRPGAFVVVAEDEGRIVGHWAFFPVLHAEGVWIDPAYRRRGSVARRLLSLMRSSARALGFDRVWTASDSAEVTAILAHPSLGAIPMPALPFILPIGDK